MYNCILCCSFLCAWCWSELGGYRDLPCLPYTKLSLLLIFTFCTQVRAPQKHCLFQISHQPIIRDPRSMWLKLIENMKKTFDVTLTSLPNSIKVLQKQSDQISMQSTKFHRNRSNSYQNVNLGAMTEWQTDSQTDESF